MESYFNTTNFYMISLIANNLLIMILLWPYHRKTLGEYRLVMSDSWYALSYEKMIEENKLIVVENKDLSHPYNKVLRAVT